MNLQFYFDPVEFENFHDNGKFSRHSFGYRIEKATHTFYSQKPIKPLAALIGIPIESSTPNKGTALAPDEIRKHIYRLCHHDTEHQFIDLGNLKKGKTDQDIYYALRDITDYLNESGIISVFIGGGHDLSIGICRAFQNMPDFTLTIVDSKINMKKEREVSDSTNFISRILRENPKLFHLQILGIQQHFSTPSQLEFLRRNTFDYLQLGTFRDDVTYAEPLIRNTHFLSFDFCSIRSSDSGGNSLSSPNGFFSEEACLISRYAGLSNRLVSFGLFEVNPKSDQNGSAVQLAAQIIWYFLEGAIHRRKEDPLTNKESFTRFYVEVEDHGEPLIFYHHTATNRWWIEFFPEEGVNWILACNESSYKQAIKGEIPEICWKYVRKTTRLSK